MVLPEHQLGSMDMSRYETFTRYYYVPFASHQVIADFLATKPVGCGDGGAEFAASFINWAVAMAQKPVSSLNPTETSIRASLRDGFPEMSATEYIRVLELYGRECRHHYKFHKGEIKDPHNYPQCETARSQLFACLYTKDEKLALHAQHPLYYPLKPPGQEPYLLPYANPLTPGAPAVLMSRDQFEYAQRTNWEFVGRAAGVVAQWGDDTGGMAMRTKPGEDSDMAESLEGLGLSRQREGGDGQR
ncbi:hypothetical protein B0A55_02095 [Friedmanniomyces simplex]|uniref:Uncharacterized protein n=1 Tax=Friedmanniomyces simplex TaxID=329884 RepID=A0A4U0XWM0_9PEZI|nr:hypothetical protein B0A55_02095 [Friedmanniomyces simplex]